MAANESKFSPSEQLIIAVLVILAMIVTTIAVVPRLRDRAKTLFLSQNRQILAKVSGSLGKDAPSVTILKISSTEGLSLEIYLTDPETESLKLMTKITLDEKRDAFFSFKGNATNLALADVDNDGELEIIAPAYDDQMVARLNVFKYNASIKSFERMQSPPPSIEHPDSF